MKSNRGESRVPMLMSIAVLFAVVLFFLGKNEAAHVNSCKELGGVLVKGSQITRGTVCVKELQ